MSAKIYNLSDFSLIKSSLSEFADSVNISELSLAFMPYYLMQLFNDLQLDEIYDCITDTQFTSSVVNVERGHDAGIDAIYINDDEKKPVIHIFSFKYTDKFEKINNNFPSSELTNLKMFITDLMSKSEGLISRVNPILSTKIKDIWKIFDEKAPKIVIHLSSNLSKGIVLEEMKDFRDFLKHYHTITVKEETIEDLLRVAISELSLAFMPYYLMQLFNDLQLDEIYDCITDTQFTSSVVNVERGHDAGIDAIYINDDEKKPVIHIFSFKYTDKFEKINNNFPSSELTNLKMFITDLMSKSEGLISRVNPILSTKIKDILKSRVVMLRLLLLMLMLENY